MRPNLFPGVSQQASCAFAIDCSKRWGCGVALEVELDLGANVDRDCPVPGRHLVQAQIVKSVKGFHWSVNREVEQHQLATP